MPDLAQDRHEQRNELVARMRRIIDGADEAERTLTAEERQEIERVEDEVRDLEADAEARDRVQRAAEATATIFERGLGNRDEPAGVRDAEDEAGLRARAEGIRTADTRELPGSLNEYRRLLRGQRPQDGDAYRLAWYKNVVLGREALSPQEARDLSVGTATAGGNLVPAEFQRELIPVLRDFGVMRQLARVITTSTGSDLNWPRVTSHGDAAWTAEAAAFHEADDAFDQITLKANKATTLMRTSEELLQDSAFDLEAYIRDEFGQRIGTLENAGYVAGSGTGQPRGFLQDAPVGDTLPTGNTTSVTGDGLINLYHSVRLPYRRNGVFLANDTAVATVRKVKDSTGQYLWQPGLQSDIPDTLLGKPFYTDPDMPVPAADATPVAFGDFSAYIIRDVDGIFFQRLNELYAAAGQIGFRSWHRTDGALTVVEAVKVLKNSHT